MADEDATETLTADGVGDDGGAVTPDPRPSARGRLPWVVAGIAVLVAIAAVVTATVLVGGARSEIGRIEDVEQVAGEFALALTTWDASDGMADTREQLREIGTGTFADDVDQLFGGTDDLATLEELGARSSGEVRDVLVQAIEGDTAVALAVVVQRVSTDVTEGEEVSLRYARLDLAHDGDRWRVDQVELVVDALQEAAQRTDPSQLPGFGEDAVAPEDAEAPQGEGGTETDDTNEDAP